MSTIRRSTTALAVVTFALAGCDLDDDTGGSDAGTAASVVEDAVEDTTDDAVDDTTDDTAADAVEDVVDSDVPCTQDDLSGDDDEFAFVVAYPVVDGQLAAACLRDGEGDEVLLDAWDSLAAITPPDQLTDLGMFAGFVPGGDSEGDTLAFVNALDVDGSQFQMSVNLDAATADPDELLLTLAHEMTHVFASTPSQLDRTAEAIDECDTYDNGDGCYLPDALIYQWIEAFWPADVLAEVDPFEDSEEGAEARCANDAGFFGA